MSVLFIVLSIVMAVVSVGLVALILAQKKRAAGLTGVVAGAGASQTYWDKNKGRSIEGKLVKYTVVLICVYFVLSLALNVIH